MTISVDHANKWVLSTASITDAVACHLTLRELEDDPEGVIHPVIHQWRALALGNGGYFYQIDLLNGYRWKFPNAGNYEMLGNINGDIVPADGVYVERQTSAAYITTAVGGSGPSAESIAAAVLAALQATTIPVDTKKMNGHTIIGDGSEANPWRGVGVSP